MENDQQKTIESLKKSFSSLKYKEFEIQESYKCIVFLDDYGLSEICGSIKLHNLRYNLVYSDIHGNIYDYLLNRNSISVINILKNHEESLHQCIFIDTNLFKIYIDMYDAFAVLLYVDSIFDAKREFDLEYRKSQLIHEIHTQEMKNANEDTDSEKLKYLLKLM
jgi:hypothetical protein